MALKTGKINVFFNISRNSRGRQRDTAHYVPTNVIGITPQFKVPEEGSIPKSRNFLFSKALSFNPFLINIKEVKDIDSSNIDLIYSYGAFLKNPKANYILEIDNPACLTYYGLIALYNPIIKQRIKKLLLDEKLKKIIAISEAAKKGLANLFGPEVEQKIEVVYPYFSKGWVSNPKKSQTESELPSFIFISYNFYIKGGREILKALKNLKGKYFLTMITSLPNEINLNNFQGMENIKLLGHTSRSDLLKNIIPNQDVVLHPTYMDSFGIAPYECINSGLAGIGTDVYAIPEFMENEKNAFLFSSPIDYFNKDFLPNAKFWLFNDVESYVKSRSFPEVEKKLSECMQYYIDNPSELKNHKAYSEKLHNEKFSPKARNKKLEKIFSESA